MKRTLKNILITLVLMSIWAAVAVAFHYFETFVPPYVSLIVVISIMFTGIYYIVSHGEVKERKTIAWLVVNKYGTEWRFKTKPRRYSGTWISSEEPGFFLSRGTIRSITGQELTYKDEPVEITINERINK